MTHQYSQRLQAAIYSPWFVPAALFGLCLIVLGDVLLGGRRGAISASDGDIAGYFIYSRQYGFAHLRAGHIPQWNPHIYSGAPYFGGWQAGLLYPLNWIYFIAPIRLALAFDVAISTFLTGLFTAMLASKYMSHPAARLLAGTVAMFSGAFFAHVWPGHLSDLAAMAWAPLVLLAADEIIDRPNLRSLLVGIAAIAMQLFAGHPQTVFNTAFTVAVYALIRLIHARPVARIVASLAAVAAGGALIASIQLLTGMQTASEGVRSGATTMSFASLFSFPPENILTLVAPHFFGNMHSVEYWGRSYYWEATAFVGVGAVVLAVAGFAHGASQRRRLWLTMALLLFVIALGGYTPLFVLLYKYVPGFARFRSHNRFIYESTLFAALLASAGLDAILQGVKISRAVVMAAWVLAAIVGVLAAAAWVPPGSIEHFAILAHPAQVLAQTSLGIAAAVAILAAIAVSLCSRSHRWGYALALLAVIELVSFGRTMVTTFRLSNACPPVLQAWRRAHPGDFRVLQLAYPYDSAMALGAYEVWGYDPVVLRRYSELLTASQGGDVNNPRMSLSFDRPTSVVRLLGCRYLLAKMPGRVVAYPIYGALPPASIIYSYYLLQDRNQIFDLLLSPSFDGRGVVVLERRPGIALGQPTATPSVSLKWLDTDSMEVEATTQAAGILLVNETYSHFWRATALPGSVQQSYAIQPGDYTQIAIPVQAGRHRIYLNYCPPLFKVGADLSILALIAFLGLTIYVWRSPVPKAARQ